jgi:hypothetical protein
MNWKKLERQRRAKQGRWRNRVNLSNGWRARTTRMEYEYYRREFERLGVKAATLDHRLNYGRVPRALDAAITRQLDWKEHKPLFGLAEVFLDVLKYPGTSSQVRREAFALIEELRAAAMGTGVASSSKQPVYAA